MTLDPSNIAQAAQLRQAAQTLGSGISQLQELRAQIRRQWYGPASDAFCVQLDRLILQMQDTDHQIRTAADALEAVRIPPL